MKLSPSFAFLARRNTIAVILLLLAWLLITDLIWLVPARQRIRASASELSLQTADGALSYVNLSLSTANRDMENAAASIVAEPGRTNIVLERLVKRNSAFINAAIVDRSGVERNRYGQFSAERPADYATLSNLYLALAGSPGFGDVFYENDSTPHVFATVPVGESSDERRVLVVEVNLKDLISIAHSFQRGNSHVYILDKNGREILDADQSIGLPRNSLLYRAISQKVIIDGQVADGLSPDDAYLNDKGVRMFAVGESIRVTGWGLFVEQSERDAFADDSFVIALASVIFLLELAAVAVALWSYYRLAALNERLEALVHENDQGARLLVARDMELSETNAHLQELDEMKSDFVSVAAHQLRTPITGIRWSFNALLDRMAGPLNVEQEKIINDGLRVTISAIDLINDLLDVARVEEGRFGYHLERLSPSGVVDEALRQISKRAEGKGVVVHADVPKTLPELMFDKEKLLIALNNLLENAVKYTAPGGSVSVVIRASAKDVECSVKDSGIGIPAGDVKKLFTKFFRAENAKLFQTSGTGLGLYMVKNIIEKQGGHIAVQSEEGKGTTVTFTLPISS